MLLRMPIANVTPPPHHTHHCLRPLPVWHPPHHHRCCCHTPHCQYGASPAIAIAVEKCAHRQHGASPTVPIAHWCTHLLPIARVAPSPAVAVAVRFHCQHGSSPTVAIAASTHCRFRCHHCRNHHRRARPLPVQRLPCRRCSCCSAYIHRKHGVSPVIAVATHGAPCC